MRYAFLSLSLLLYVNPGLAQSIDISEYVMPSQVIGGLITAGPDGALWITGYDQFSRIGKITRVTTTGNFTEYSISSAPAEITTGPDGALWFTEPDGNKIGQITTTGVITEYPLPQSNSAPLGITTGPDGALWFTERRPGRLGRITTAGAITEYPTSPYTGPNDIITGPDGALWFTEDVLGAPSKIGRMTTAGAITDYFIPNCGSCENGAITVGAGALWFTFGDKIGRITTNGAVTLYMPPGKLSRIDNIAKGPDGAFWFTVQSDTDGVGKVGRTTASGETSLYSLPASHHPHGIVAGPDGALWFTEYESVIGRLSISTNTGVLPQVVYGGPWTSTITITNTGSDAGSATLHFFDDYGNPLQLPLSSPQGAFDAVTTNSFTAAVSPNSTLLIRISAPSTREAQEGWAQVNFIGTLSGSALFSLEQAAGKQEAVVSLETRSPAGFVLPFDNTNGYTNGIAVANASSQNTMLDVIIRDSRGTIQLADSIGVGAFGHASFVLTDFFPSTAGEQGTIEFSTRDNGRPIGILELRFTSTGFSSIPPIAK
jgi:virginiamycin B lyase